MRFTQFVVAAVIASALPATAMAQSTTGQPPPPPTPSTTSYGSSNGNEWMVSGYVGSAFGTSLGINDFDDVDLENGASFSFGGQLAYLWGGVIGGEFLMDFSPSFNATVGNLAFDGDPNLNSYMFNVIAAVPIGGDHEFQPYVSGGLGSIQAAADVFNVITNPGLGTTRVSNSRLGADIGGGIMAFAGSVGFRADVRYFRTGSNDNLVDVLDLDEVFRDSLLSDISFWRANVGVSFRW